MRFRYAVALLAAFALLAAACGDDDDTASSGDDSGDSSSGGGTLDIDAILGADLDDCADAPTGDPIRVGMAMDFSDVVGFVDIPGSDHCALVVDLSVA